MALPVLNDSPLYEATVPSTDEVIRFRPFLVKEQRTLLIAFESQDRKQILSAVLDTIQSCAGVDPRDWPMHDVEYIFVQIRAKSVGESADVSIACAKCGNKTAIKVDFNDVVIDKQEISNVIKLTEDIDIELKHPSFYDMLNNHIITSEDATVTDRLTESILLSISAVLTEEERIVFKDESHQEKLRFFNSLTNDQFALIKDYIDAAPKMIYDAKFTCESCGYENERRLSTIDDFFS